MFSLLYFQRTVRRSCWRSRSHSMVEKSKKETACLPVCLAPVQRTYPHRLWPKTRVKRYAQWREREKGVCSRSLHFLLYSRTTTAIYTRRVLLLVFCSSLQRALYNILFIYTFTASVSPCHIELQSIYILLLYNHFLKKIITLWAEWTHKVRSLFYEL